MAARTNSVNQVTLIKDNTAPVNLSQAVSTVLFVQEPSFTKETVWLNGIGQQALLVDKVGPVNISGAVLQVLAVTEPSFGVDVPMVTKVVHHAIIVEPNLPVYSPSTSQQVLVVTERPPGNEAVNISKATQLTLIVEPALVSTSATSQQVLIVTDPAPPLSAVTISGARSAVLVEDPPAPARVGQVSSRTIVLREGPILTAGLNQVLHSALTLDLTRGTTLANGAAQSTLLLTEAKSRDPDRAKVLTITSTHVKPYAHPSTFASNHRARLMVRNDVLSTNFKSPELVAAAHRTQIMVMETAKVQEFVDPRDLAAKIQAGTLEISAVVKTPYPEHVISDAVAQSAFQEVAQKWIAANPLDVQSDSDAAQLFAETAIKSLFLSPLDVRSPTLTATAFAEIATKATAVDPDTYRTEKRPLQIAHMSMMLSEMTADPVDLKSNNQVSVLDIAAAHRSTVYPKDVQSDTVVNSLLTQVLSATPYTSPTDPIFKSMIHLNRLKFETMSYCNLIQEPQEIQSPAALRNLSVRHAVKAAFAAPEDVISTNVISELYTELACEREMVDPAGVKPGRQLYQIQFSSAFGSEHYNILPTSSIAAQRLKTETASPITMRNPIDLGVTDRVYLVGILTAVEAAYTDPSNAKPKRRVSSARVTRK